MSSRPPLRFDRPLRGRIYDSIAETIGNTPLVRIPNITAEDGIKAADGKSEAIWKAIQEASR